MPTWATWSEYITIKWKIRKMSVCPSTCKQKIKNGVGDFLTPVPYFSPIFNQGVTKLPLILLLGYQNVDSKNMRAHLIFCSQFLEFMEKYCSDSISDHQKATCTNFSTYQHSMTVVSYAQFCSDDWINNWVGAKQYGAGTELQLKSSQCKGSLYNFICKVELVIAALC